MVNKQQQQRLLFLAAKGWIKSACTPKHVKEIRTNMSNTAKLLINWLAYGINEFLTWFVRARAV